MLHNGLSHLKIKELNKKGTRQIFSEEKNCDKKNVEDSENGASAYK